MGNDRDSRDHNHEMSLCHPDTKYYGSFGDPNGHHNKGTLTGGLLLKFDLFCTVHLVPNYVYVYHTN